MSLSLKKKNQLIIKNKEGAALFLLNWLKGNNKESRSLTLWCSRAAFYCKILTCKSNIALYASTETHAIGMNSLL